MYIATKKSSSISIDSFFSKHLYHEW